jgi:hypothetical protein
LEGHDFGVDARLADAPGDQLGDLAAEIDDENRRVVMCLRGVVLGGVLHRQALEPGFDAINPHTDLAVEEWTS